MFRQSLNTHLTSPLSCCRKRGDSWFQETSCATRNTSLRRWEHFWLTGLLNSTTSSKCGPRLCMWLLGSWITTWLWWMMLKRSSCSVSVSLHCKLQANTKKSTLLSWKLFWNVLIKLLPKSKSWRWSPQSWQPCSSMWLSQVRSGSLKDSVT